MRSLADEVQFDIPDSWEWVRLIDVCEYIQREKSPKYSLIKKYPVVAQKCNQWSGFSIEKAQFIEPDSLSSYGPERLLQDNDLMWNSTGLGTLGRMAIYKIAANPYELAVADSHVTVIRPLKQFVLPEYLYYYFANPTVQSVIEDQADGTTKQKELATATIKAYLTPIPPLDEHKINIAATKPAAAWIEEGGALTFGDATFDQIILDAHKLHVAVKVTEELLYDNAFNLENYILEQFGKALANAEEDAFINGNGTGQPLGILAETGGAQVGVTTKSSGKVTADEIIDLVYSLKRPYRKNAVFLANDACVAELRKLKDSTGQYLWQPSLQAGEPDRVLGYKIYTSAYFPLPAPGKAAVAFGDFSYYNIGDRGSRSIAELKELFAGNGMVGFVAKERVDGKLVLPEAVKLLKMASA